MGTIDVITHDVLSAPGDILVLKYAGSPHGADAAVARAVSRDLSVAKGQYAFFPTSNRIEASEILVLGVEPLRRFEYAQIQQFADDAIRVVRRERPGAHRVLITIHGPGYGLDELAATDSLLRGLRRGLVGSDIQVFIVEKDPRRATRIAALLGLPPERGIPAETGFDAKTADEISHGNTFSKRLFTALPFKDAFRDHWELAIQPAAHECQYVCERLDHEAFTGDIVLEIRARIEKSRAVLALLDDLNANVFLEVGYAWGVKKPTVLMLAEGVEPPFDVRGQNIVRYGRLGELKDRLRQTLTGLAANGAI